MVVLLVARAKPTEDQHFDPKENWQAGSTILHGKEVTSIGVDGANIISPHTTASGYI
jgi:hypothetical protein